MNRERCGKIVVLESEYYDLRMKLEKEAATLLMQVENGTSMKGSCKICANAQIG